MSLPQMPWKTNSLPFLYSLLSFLCLFSFPSVHFHLSLFLKRVTGIPCFAKYFPGDMYVIKVCNIWNLDNMFKIIMVMLIVIVIRASNYYVFYIRGTVLWTLYTSANLILTEALGISKYYHSAQFTVKKTEAKGGAGTCQKSHSKWQSSGFNTGLLDSKSQPSCPHHLTG